MLDLKILRENPAEVLEKIKDRGIGTLNSLLAVALPNELSETEASEEKKLNALIEWLKSKEEQRKNYQTKMQEWQHLRNTKSKEIGQAKAKNLNTDQLFSEVEALSNHLKKSEEEFETLFLDLQKFYDILPNIPHDSVPKGKSEAENREERRWDPDHGTTDSKALDYSKDSKTLPLPKPFSFQVKDHVSLCEGTLDFEASAKLVGSRFVVMYGEIAALHRALVQFMLSLHIQEHGYQEVYIPYMVSSACLYGTGQFPKFKNDQFKIEDEDLWLIPTSEVSVTNLHREEIIDWERLPLKYVCYSPCFRKEAGSYGKDLRGMFRQHQFDKVEMVQLVAPENSYDTLENMVKHAETLLQRLKLPYRVVSLCTGDLGFQSAKTYDLEVWLPSEGRYREISSCSNTESFQARRMQGRFRHPQTKKPEYLHTLNGSGLAVGRTLIAVLENYQDKDGNIHIPEALQPYFKKEVIFKKK